MGEVRDDTISLDSQSGVEEAGLTAYAVAAEFNTIAFPPNMPSWLVEAIERQATQAQRAEGADRFFNASVVGSADLKARAERERQAEEDTAALFVTIAEERRREQEEWDRSLHSYAGVEMSGADWRKLGDDLKRNGELRDLLITKLMKDGKTRSEAERGADEIADVATILAKPNSQRTADEQHKVDEAEPRMREIMPWLQEQRMSGTSIEAERATSHTSRVTSVSSGADLFASAPDLSAHHAVASTAVGPTAVPLEISPVQAQPAPSPNGMAGLDI